jgi:hypothetical protein
MKVKTLATGICWILAVALMYEGSIGPDFWRGWGLMCTGVAMLFTVELMLNHHRMQVGHIVALARMGAWTPEDNVAFTRMVLDHPWTPEDRAQLRRSIFPNSN